MISLFRYSGNKNRLIPHYRGRAVFPAPAGTRRLVEPYLGSGAFSIQALLAGFEGQVCGSDQSAEVVALWDWLRSPQAEEDLLRLLDWSQQQEEKVDIRTLGLDPGPLLYLKLNSCGAYVGQWGSWTYYPQHNLPVLQTIRLLPLARKVQVTRKAAEDWDPQPGDAYFLDPPYVGTVGGYVREKEYDPSTTMDLIGRCQERGVPVLVSYGSGAPEVFPDLEWELVKRRKVPRIRTGGTVERQEYIARVGWPRPFALEDLFS